MNATPFYSALMRVRPAQVCDALKVVLQIRRRVFQTSLGLSFFVDPVSRLGTALMREGRYEPGLTKVFGSILRDGDVCVDLGANEGYFSVLAARGVGPEGIVHGVEPQSRLQPVLMRNFELNSVGNTTIHRLAIGQENAEVPLFLRPSTNTGASSFYRHWRLGSVTETVKSVTLDRFFEMARIRQARLMKVDCEGAEWDIVQGAGKILAEQAVDVIAMVYHRSICGSERCNEVHLALTNAGYAFSKVEGECLYYAPSAQLDFRGLSVRACQHWAD